MKFFKPEDFVNPLVGKTLDWPTVFHQVADIANAKLEREGKVVYFEMQHSWIEHYPVDKFGNNSSITKQALLINIEPIEKCKHLREKIRGYLEMGQVEWQCECGAKVQPKEFEEIK